LISGANENSHLPHLLRSVRSPFVFFPPLLHIDRSHRKVSSPRLTSRIHAIFFFSCIVCCFGSSHVRPPFLLLVVVFFVLPVFLSKQRTMHVRGNPLFLCQARKITSYSFFFPSTVPTDTRLPFSLPRSTKKGRLCFPSLSTGEKSEDHGLLLYSRKARMCVPSLFRSLPFWVLRLSEYRSFLSTSRRSGDALLFQPLLKTFLPSAEVIPNPPKRMEINSVPPQLWLLFLAIRTSFLPWPRARRKWRRPPPPAPSPLDQLIGVKGHPFHAAETRPGAFSPTLAINFEEDRWFPFFSITESCHDRLFLSLPRLNGIYVQATCWKNRPLFFSAFAKGYAPRSSPFFFPSCPPNEGVK